MIFEILHYINLLDAILMIVACVIYWIVCYIKKGNKNWLISYSSLTIGLVIYCYSHINDFILMLSNICFMIATITIFLAVLREYLQIPRSLSNSRLDPNIIKINAVFMIPFLFIIEITMICLLTISIIMLAKIYKIKKTPSHIILSLALGACISGIFFFFLDNLGFEFAYELGTGFVIFYVTLLLTNGLVAFIEEKLIESEKEQRAAFNRAEFYKDLFTHDINNILQAIESSIDLLSLYNKKTKIEIKIDDIIKSAKDQVRRGANLGSNVKNLSEIEKGDIEFDKIEIIKVLRKSIDEIKAKYNEISLNIKIESNINLFFIKANFLLKDLFKNIISNAIKHNINSVVDILIKISTFKENKKEKIKIEFIDNGMGIPDDVKATISRRSYYEDRDHLRIGLGLSLIREIIKSYNGKIWIEDKDPVNYTYGSNFIITLPEYI